MSNDEFIKSLKKYLSGLDRASREDIVREIKSHAADSGDSLFDRFGSPRELARN